LKGEWTLKVSIGHGAYAEEMEVDLIFPPSSSPVKRKIDDADKSGMLYNLTAGRKTRSVFSLKSGKIVLCALETDTLAARLNEAKQERRGKKRRVEKAGEPNSYSDGGGESPLLPVSDPRIRYS
jgi:regulator of extracellular matrix RemA (YlzA/DUF370 family)